MGSPKSGTRGALHARCSRLWGMFQVPSGMHTVLLLSTLAWLCYLGAWLLLDVSLGNHLQVSPVPGLRTWLQIPRPYIGHNPVCQAHPQLAPCDCTRHASLACFCCLVQCTRSNLRCCRPAIAMLPQTGIATMLAEQTHQTHPLDAALLIAVHRMTGAAIPFSQPLGQTSTCHFYR